MAEKVLKLNPRRGFFSGDGIHLINPEKPVVKMVEDYEVTPGIERAIRLGILLDVNGNILVPKKQKNKDEAPKESKAPKEAPAIESEEAPVEEKEVAPAEEKKKETKAKSKTKK